MDYYWEYERPYQDEEEQYDPYQYQYQEERYDSYQYRDQEEWYNPYQYQHQEEQYDTYQKSTLQDALNALYQYSEESERKSQLSEVRSKKMLESFMTSVTNIEKHLGEIAEWIKERKAFTQHEQNEIFCIDSVVEEHAVDASMYELHDEEYGVLDEFKDELRLFETTQVSVEQPQHETTLEEDLLEIEELLNFETILAHIKVVEEEEEQEFPYKQEIDDKSLDNSHSIVKQGEKQSKTSNLFSLNITYLGSFDLFDSSFSLPDDESYFIQFDNSHVYNNLFQGMEELETLYHRAKDVLVKFRSHGKHGVDSFPFDNG